MSIYYVYAYLRSKDSTTAPAGTPYYIGKGSNGRAYGNHGSINLPPDRSYISFLEENLSENKAFEIEKFLIAYHGRKDIGTGILLNRTDGGEGTSGTVVSDETRQLMSIASLGKPKSEEHKANISKAQKGNKHWLGKQHNETTKKRMREAQLNEKNHQFGTPRLESTKKQISATMKGRPHPIVQCPHCGKEGGMAAMKRYHFMNCKHKLQDIPIGKFNCSPGF